MTDLDEVADALYGLTPQAFTVTRDEQVKAARQAGDRELAKQIGTLRKPTLSAWLVNLLVRQDVDTVEAFLALGADLRDAQEGMRGAELRALSVQRQQAVSALAARARQLATDAGHPVTDTALAEAESTLTSALADPASEAAVRAGRLTTALSYSGLGVAPQRRSDGMADATATEAAPATGQPRKRTLAPAARVAEDELAAKRAQAAQRRREKAVAAAESAVRYAESRVAEQDSVAAEAADVGERAAEALDAARQQLASAEGAAGEAQQALEAAREDQTAAARDLAAALEALKDLQG